MHIFGIFPRVLPQKLASKPNGADFKIQSVMKLETAQLHIFSTESWATMYRRGLVSGARGTVKQGQE